MGSIGIRIKGEYLDLAPGTRIQRERSSPLFIDSTSGTDSIPGEISYPVTIPMTDKNLRLLSYPDSIPAPRELSHDITLEESGMQLSGGRLILETVTSNLVKNNTGHVDGYIYSNVSEFWSRVKNKKLKELKLGGTRTFSWTGYSTTTGFWGHCHSTWDYTNYLDGDYVFFPVIWDGWEGDTGKWMNRWVNLSGASITLARGENVETLCPHPYLCFILKSIFAEHGYALEGDILSDPDFMQICLLSYNGIFWARRSLGMMGYPTVVQTPIPLSTISFTMADHVPPETTIGTFLVELQKFLPICFVIDDRAKKCTILWTNQIRKAGSESVTEKFNPNYSLTFDNAATPAKVFGIERKIDDDVVIEFDPTVGTFQGIVNVTTALPTAAAGNVGDVYFVKYYNRYYQCFEEATGTGTSIFFWQPVFDNLHGIKFDGQTDSIESNIGPVPLRPGNICASATGPGFINGFFPRTKHTGNWSGGDQEFSPWGIRVIFYRGRLAHNSGVNLPFASPDIWNLSQYSISAAPSSFTQMGQWSMAMKSYAYGMYENFWQFWLPTLQSKEKLKGTIYLKLYEYLKLDWGKVILVQNTPYLITKITEVLPYDGSVQIEAVRIP